MRNARTGYWLVAVVLAIVAIAGLLRSGRVEASPSPSPDLGTISNQGVAISAGANMQAVLTRTGTTGGSIRQLGRRADRVFYRLIGTKRGDCYGSGFGAGPTAQLHEFECGSPFPSRDQPVLDASVVERTSGGILRVIDVHGVAADGVAKVRILDDEENLVAEAAVTDNIYLIDPLALSRGNGTQVVAEDTSGAIVFTRQFT